jgi:LacI family gluconate utilization system Gnt-I transcriptional repressor
VAAVVPTIAGPVFLQTVQSLTEALAEHGYQLMLGQSGYTESREDALLEAIIGRRPDGIVLTGILHSVEGRRRLLAAGIPVVETWDLTPTPLDMLVGFSHAEVGRAVVHFLRTKGRRRLAVVAGDDERSRRRHQAFRDAARAAGLPEAPLIYVPAPTTLGSGRRALAELLASTPGIDAVFCSSDLLALGVMTEAQARGIAVPGQLAVVGFGDLEFAADVHPALTTVRIDSAAIGRQAARFIVERAEGREVAERVVDIGFSIVERASA